MNCEILETLYVRSNGDIPCNDDAGEQLLLGRVEVEPAWTITDVFTGDSFRSLRGSLGAGAAPWSQCERCAWLRPFEEYSDSLAVRRIRKVQIETSLSCNLRCPGCSNQQQVLTRPRPHMMAVELAAQLFDALATERYAVDEIEYCGQGEPLLHPKFPHFVSLAREAYPEAVQRVITNGNVDYAKATGREGINEIFVSCDGARQSSYEQYRIGGKVERALRFMRDVPDNENGVRQRLIWKYILLDFNDSVEELQQAQHMAQDLGVDLLLFVLTHSEHRSERWLAANAAEIPILYPNVRTSVTPVQQRSAGIVPVDEWTVRGYRRPKVLFAVDQLTFDGTRLECAGWGWVPHGVESIAVDVDGRPLGTLTGHLPRPDVGDVHPHVGPRSGFAGHIAGDLPTTGVHRIDVVLTPLRGRPVRIGRRYEFGRV